MKGFLLLLLICLLFTIERIEASCSCESFEVDEDSFVSPSQVDKSASFTDHLRHRKDLFAERNEQQMPISFSNGAQWMEMEWHIGPTSDGNISIRLVLNKFLADCAYFSTEINVRLTWRRSVEVIQHYQDRDKWTMFVLYWNTVFRRANVIDARQKKGLSRVSHHASPSETILTTVRLLSSVKTCCGTGD